MPGHDHHGAQAHGHFVEEDRSTNLSRALSLLVPMPNIC